MADAADDFASTLGPLRQLVNEDLRVWFSERLSDADLYHSFVAAVYREVREFVCNMGAQVSALALATSAGVGRPLDAASARLGTAIELYSYGVLVHDDILDRDDSRFGKPSLHCIFAAHPAAQLGTTGDDCHFGHSMALLAGSLMQSLAVEAILGLPLRAECATRLAQLLASGYRRLTESQVVDVAFEHTLPSSDEWYAMARQRAAQHISTTVALGGVLSDWPAPVANAMVEFARHLGLAFDIRDDLMDAFGADLRLPSKSGRDMARSKKPLLFCIAAERAPSPARDRLLRSLREIRSASADPPRAAVADVLAVMTRFGLEPTVAALEGHLRHATEALSRAALLEPYHSLFHSLLRKCRDTVRTVAEGATLSEEAAALSDS